MKYIDATKVTDEALKAIREASEPCAQYEADLCFVMGDMSLLYREVTDRSNPMMLRFVEPLDKIKLRRLLDEEVSVSYDGKTVKAQLLMTGLYYKLRIDRYSFVSFEFDKVVSVDMNTKSIKLS